MTFSETLKRRWYVAILGIIIIILFLNWGGFIHLPGAQNTHLDIRVDNKSVITFIAYDETSKALPVG